MNVVVVESPAKAKTINKYLGKDYTVVASYGHVRDLPPKDGSVRPDQNFAMDWEVEGRAVQRVGEIAKALKGADKLYLATDPDREGEAISWHVLQVLAARKALKGVDVKRVVFNEVTKSAVLEAFAHPRDINQELVDAYLARRALDYLVGFTLSPVLWRKLPGSRSAGRVQSVALRLICEREAEIEVFKNQEYWTVEVTFKTADGANFVARLTHLDGTKLERLGLSAADAERARVAIEASSFAVVSVEKKTTRRHPQPPFTTSTLQQEASRKLGFGAVRTMKIAQRLYEGIDIGGETVGLISYMRTDGVQLSAEAITGTRSLIGRDYGERYVPGEPRIYRTRAKNAQEAHEAIRPTDVSRRPADVALHLEDEQRKLYELIWRRTVASQMESAILDQSTIDIASPDGKLGLRATGSVVVFDGFLTLYQEGRDDSDDEDGQARLPKLAERDPLERGLINPEQHFTQPPPRYSEASLVKKLEELGIGRPSTYASIIQVLQDRSYVRIDQRRFIPEDRGRLVTQFLSSFFERYVEYGFTADLEAQLDEVSGGRVDWRTVLREFWGPFIAAIDGTKDLTITQVIDALDAALGQHFFPAAEGEGRDPRLCPSCQSGRLGLRLGRTGGFIGCSNYPNCRYTRPLAVEANGGAHADGTDLGQPKQLGQDPKTGEPVSLRKGPFGIYVQLGETDKEAKIKPKRASLPKTVAPGEVTIELALGLLSLPREIGIHPETGQPITAGIGRFGPYLKLGPVYKSLPKDDDVLTIGLNRAVVLLAETKEKATPIRVVGSHPTDQAEIAIYRGRFGPFLQHDGVRANLPRSVTPETITLDEAVALLSARAAEGSGKRGARKTKSKTTSAPKAAKKPSARTRSKPKAAKPAAAASEPKPRRASAKSADGD